MPYLPRFADYPTIGLRVLLHQGPSTQSLRFPQAPMVLGTPIWVLPSGSWPGQSCAWSPPEGGPAMAMSWALGSYRDKVALCEWAWGFYCYNSSVKFTRLIHCYSPQVPYGLRDPLMGPAIRFAKSDGLASHAHGALPKGVLPWL